LKQVSIDGTFHNFYFSFFIKSRKPIAYKFFLLVSREKGHASRRSNDVPTRLVPRWTPILYRQSQILLKKGEKLKESGLDQNPRTKKTKKKKIEDW